MANRSDKAEQGPRLGELLYRQHPGSDAEDLSQAARGWLDAVHVFATDALDAGVSASEVLPAVVQMLEGWMLARDAASLTTTWMALDATVTALERRLAQTRVEREGLREQSATLRAERDAARRRHRRRRRRRGGKRKR